MWVSLRHSQEGTSRGSWERVRSREVKRERLQGQVTGPGPGHLADHEKTLVKAVLHGARGVACADLGFKVPGQR